MQRTFPLLLLIPWLAACGGDVAESIPWQHVEVEGVAKAGGLALYGRELLVVCGANERRVFAVPLDALAEGDRVRARALEVERDDDAYLMGADLLSTQGYRLHHLWSLQVDFQGIGVQPPHFVYLADRMRRVVYWGRLTPDAAGRTQHVRLQGCVSAPGAHRAGAKRGDWRDKGPGLAGIAGVTDGGKTEDLCAIDQLPGEGGFLRVFRMNRYGSSMGAVEVRPGGSRHVAGLARRKGGVLLLHADGGVSDVRDPKRDETVNPQSLDDLPEIAGVAQWTGIARGPDGTLYAVSDSDPAVLAWRAAASTE